MNDLIESNQVMQSTSQTWVANARLEFSGEARFQIFTRKWLLGNIKYFISFKLNSLKLNGLDRTLLYPNTDHQPESFYRLILRSKLVA